MEKYEYHMTRANRAEWWSNFFSFLSVLFSLTTLLFLVLVAKEVIP